MEEERLVDDDGFYAYVPNTADVGPIMLVATIAIGVLLVVTLPFAVILGEKYEELNKRTRANNVLSDSEEGGPEESKQVAINGMVPKGTDESSTSSQRSYISAISGAIKDVIENSGRPIRGAGHIKNRHRHRAAVDRKKFDKSQYSQNFEIMEVWDEPSQQMRAVLNPPSPDATASEDEAIRAPHAPLGQEFSDGGHPTSDCGMSDLGVDDHKKTPALDGYEVPLNARNVCLTVPGFLDEIANIFAWDVEMKRIFKLSIPFVLQAISTGTLDTLTVAVVSKLLGTSAVSAYVIVRLLVELTTRFVGGFHEAMWTNCSHAIGNGKDRLCGKYTQISAVLYMVGYIPFAVMWVFLLDDTLAWFGFDEEVISLGTQYGHILLVYYFMAGISESIHGLLDVAGYENFSTVIHAAEEVVTFTVILVWALTGKPALYMIGLVQLGNQVVFLIATILIIWWKGWFQPYLGGMLSSCAILDRKAVWLVCMTALPLSFGYLLTDGEWEILTFFASHLGPAEVVAWGLMGSVWDSINRLVDAVSDASEVRVAFLMGSGQADRARLSAHKSIMISIYVSLYTTSGLFICGEDMPKWLTNDATLQQLLRDLLPLFGFGNAAMTIGTMSWTLLGAQGRYRLATKVVCMTSWCITLPLAAVFSIYLNLNLQGQTAAMFIGYMISGAIHAYYLFRSDWIALSQAVMDDNDSRSSDEESEEGMDDNDGNAIAESQGIAEGPEVTPEHQPQVTGHVPENTQLRYTSASANPPKRGGLPRPPSGKGGELMMEPGIPVKGEWKGPKADDVSC